MFTVVERMPVSKHRQDWRVSRGRSETREISAAVTWARRDTRCWSLLDNEDDISTSLDLILRASALGCMPGQPDKIRRSQAVGHHNTRVLIEAGGGGLPEDSKLRMISITSRAEDRELAQRSVKRQQPNSN
jgi:hypothetical protein